MVVLRYVCIYCTYLRQESHKSGSSTDGGSKVCMYILYIPEAGEPQIGEQH